MRTSCLSLDGFLYFRRSSGPTSRRTRLRSCSTTPSVCQPTAAGVCAGCNGWVRDTVSMYFFSLIALTFLSCLALAGTPANDLNKPSVNAALRLGFVLESPISIRADRSLAAGQAGSYMGRAGDPLGLVGRQVGRSTSLLSITAEEWENGTAEHVRSLVTRYKAAAGK